MSQRVLHVTAEVAPYSATGGLGLVLRELPAAQRARGWAVRVISPLYGFIDRTALVREPEAIIFELGGETHAVHLWRDAAGEHLFVDAPGLLDREHPYGPPGEAYADNPLRFAVLCKAAVALAGETDLYHLHDWQAGLVALYLRGKRRAVQSVHNLAYQGLCDFDWADTLEIPHALRGFAGLEYYGQISLLKAGLILADALGTVSPTYAREITREPGGRGLATLFRQRKNGLVGILNGVSSDLWDPATDATLPARYGATDLAGKAVCKAALRARLGLSDGPVFSVISRAATQKGLDLLAQAAPAAIAAGARFAVLADGDPQIVAQLQGVADAHPAAFGLDAHYSDASARLFHAGADFVVMPSRFEPCGLTQLIGMRYGTLPVVRATGGLADTVTDGVSGLSFEAATAEALTEALLRAIALHRDPAQAAAMQQHVMALDWSWSRAAALYEDTLYAPLVRGGLNTMPPREPAP